MATKTIKASKQSEWRVHTPNFLKEIGDNNETMSVMRQPLMIFASILEEVANRAIELDDPKLNILMLRLTLYEQGDEGRHPGAYTKIVKQQRRRMKKDVKN